MPTEFVPAPRFCRARRLTALALLLAACASEPPPLTWSQRLAAGRLDQAQAQWAAGDPAGARQSAEQALAEARAAGHGPTMARAQALLGALQSSLPRLQDGLTQLEALGDAEGLAAARLWLAELAVQARRPDLAVPVTEAVLASLPADAASRLQAAPTEARVRHLQAAALRLSGRQPEAAAAERQAALALSLLPEDELLTLRIAVAQACGDDLLLTGDARGALARHAQAAALARQAGDPAAEVRAITSLAAGLYLDGRYREAADHCERALRLARSTGDGNAARDLGARGLAALQALGEPIGSARWEQFRRAVSGG